MPDNPVSDNIYYLEPRFQHDCEKCIHTGGCWIAIGNRPGNYYDLYFHPESHDRPYGSFIARYGDEGSEYTSMPTFYSGYDRERLIQLDPRLKAAVEAAVREKLFVED